MNPADHYTLDHALPATLPADPMPMFVAWLEEARARKIQPNPEAMTLATATPDGRPSARIVLCRGVVADPGYIVCYTNRRSRKGQELASNPRAAAVFHWDALDRQVRIEGPVTLSPDEESDAYFNRRFWASRVGAWASEQSEPIADREDLLVKAAEMAARFNVDVDHPERATIPRPAHWGGYRIWAQSVELWLGHPARIHDRARWTRTLGKRGEGYAPGAWSVTRLQP